MADFNGLILTVIFTAIFFYILYGVIRAAVRDGGLQAYARILEAEQEDQRQPFEHEEKNQ